MRERFGGIQADGYSISNLQLIATEVKCLAGKNVNSDARSQCWNTTPARYRNVESVRNGVCQSMASERRAQTQRSSGSPISRFQQILINFGSIGPTVEPPPYLID